jgi:hypothetical protein
MQNNCYWSPQNPHLTHEVPLQPVKAGVWCAVSARIAGPAFFNETINCKRHVEVILRQFFPQLTEEKDPMAGFSRTQILPTLHAGFVQGLQGQNYQQWCLNHIFT